MNIVLIILAAILKSAADTMAHHYDTSVFRKIKFFDPNYKWFTVFQYPVNGWHIANSLMIVCFVAAAFSGIWIAILGAAFILVFNVFYNHILRKK